jgi:hypothetical protein
MMRFALAFAALAFFAPAAVAETRPIVLELFTSQGCSSCPPADALLAELATRPNVLALGFHVDYWDRLGWKDPLSVPGSTERQRAYARQFGTGEIYTPQMVVDGGREMVGSRRDAILAAIDEARPEAVAPIVFAQGGRSVSIGQGKGNGRILMVSFVRKRTNAVARGENAGRTAIDVNGVKEFRQLGDWAGSAVSFDIESPGANEGVAVLVQAPDGRILGAASLLGTG